MSQKTPLLYATSVELVACLPLEQLVSQLVQLPPVVRRHLARGQADRLTAKAELQFAASVRKFHDAVSVEQETAVVLAWATHETTEQDARIVASLTSDLRLARLVTYGKRDLNALRGADQRLEQEFNEAECAEDEVLAILRFGWRVREITLLVANPTQVRAVEIKPSVALLSQDLNFFERDPLGARLFTVTPPACLPNSMELELRNKPLYVKRDDMMRFLKDMGVTEPSVSPTATRQARRGRAQKYDWREFNAKLETIIRKRGVPHVENSDIDWKAQGHLEKHMTDWCQDHWGQNQLPSESTIRAKVVSWLKQHNAHVGSNLNSGSAQVP